MRAFDRDLIRGGHYGRSCEPRKQAEHMAAPTNAAGVKKVLANPEPSTHGTKCACRLAAFMAGVEGATDSKQVLPSSLQGEEGTKANANKIKSGFRRVTGPSP